MYLVIYAEEIGVTARLFKFKYKDEPRLNWSGTGKIAPGIWATLALVTSFALNILPVKVGVPFRLIGFLVINECI
jgi:hypothetical protein